MSILNMNFPEDGRTGVEQNFKVVFGHGELRSEHILAASGNVYGLDALDEALDDFYDGLDIDEEHDAPYIMFHSQVGTEEHKLIDEEFDEIQWLRRLIVSFEIVTFSHQEYEG
jgi:hypothetical protein